MLSERLRLEYYHALLSKDSGYEGVFYAGIKTTGVFCRPTCSARKPKFENCEFFTTAQQALLASYRPCKRCKPLQHPGSSSNLLTSLVELVEREPERRWKESDLRALNIDSSTARRQFKQRFGMTFIEYARARRLGMAIKMIRTGKKVIDAQVSSSYESSSGFRDAFSRIMDNPPIRSNTVKILHAAWLDTRLGPMMAITDDEALVLLEFVDRRGLELEIEKLRARTKSKILPGTNPITSSIENELALYFEGKLKKFNTPIKLIGSSFQQKVWNALREIPYGTTVSYSNIAKELDMPRAYRAVATANGKNQIAIVIPCHRVINLNGELGGYGGGIKRKEWLISHEKGVFK